MEFESSKRVVTYTVNGVKYDRLEDVPEQFRVLFKDADGNGIPDIFESGDAVRISKETRHVVTTVTGSSPARTLLSKTTTPATIRCAQCGYDLTGSTIGKECPECGLPVAASIEA